MFFIQFALGLILSSCTAAALLLIKKIFRNQLTAKWHYNLWFLLMLALTLPMLPDDVFQYEGHLAVFERALHPSADSSTNAVGVESAGDANWLQDFTVSVNQSTPMLLNNLTAGLWVSGMLVFALLNLRAWVQLRCMKRSFTPLEHGGFSRLFEYCKQSLKITGTVSAVESPYIQSPMMFGVFKTYIVFPQCFYERLSPEECRYMILHELSHYKNKDHLTNVLIIAFQLLYWFNPLVWTAFRHMRLDREIACDTAVLQSLDESCIAEYGNTIITAASRVSRPVYGIWASTFAGSSEQIKRRIEKIASYKNESKQLQRKSFFIFLLAGVLVASQIQAAAVMAREDDSRYVFETDRAVYEDLSVYFGGYDGSFVLYDTQADEYRIYNEQKSKRRISPDSTYKIYSSLFGLESGIIESDQSSIPWNGDQYPYTEWNKDQNLFTAMAGSVSWYYQELDSRVGLKRLQAYMKDIGYGNTNLSGGVGHYWLESSLKISPIEQVQLLKAFYQNQFGFKEENIHTVKAAIRLEEKNGAYLYGKTGTGTVNNKNTSGWFVGYVESRGNVHIFAANIQREDQANGSTAADIALSILRDKGIF
ncbi:MULTISPECIES: BlaR1 family beta-lactam sensor/signal transducer [Paenibacillus]|uniref:BlaR1 family beta-lactam sensor/signal transducer n=1 Tax=Paenibacillus TaxID=44249 RepID=UPI0022B8727E|nr:BlaR1 family beta-lactam sensor/signal transducer [Paenibacillus caseinilyticus]MCZ8518854.1 BlaR1 family beta-lactam sensor/signal transducer [Paenibacillus caseinilyticus]